MPSTVHDAMTEFLRSHRPIALRLAKVVGIRITAEDWRWIEGRCDFCDPTGTGSTYRADVVLVACRDPVAELDPIEGLNLEPQLGKDSSKYISLPIYATGIHTLYGCRTEQALVSPSIEVLRWAAEELFPGESRNMPYLIGPEQIAPVLDLDVARLDPAWAVFAAALHSRTIHACTAAEVALRASLGLPNDLVRQYTRLVMAGLTEPQRQVVRPHLPPELDEPISDFERECYMFVRGEEQGKIEGKIEGKREGMLQSLLKLLDRRGLEPTLAQLEHIQRCFDLDRLQRWYDAAFDAESVAALLELDA